MADESDKQDAPQLPPKLNLRKQGILQKEPTIAPDASAKRDTSRLVVEPADVDAAPSAETPEPVEAAAAATSAPAPKPEAKAVEAAAPAIKLKPLAPKAAAPKAAAADAPPDPTKADTKRKTSRIPLATATPGEPDGDSAAEPIGIKPRTIKIKPSAPVPKIRSAQPLGITVPMAEADAGAEKRKTSRIPLEEALTADKESDAPAAPADPARPRTIKIKRPGSSEAATVKLKKAPSANGDAQANMGKTARLDHLDLTDTDSTPTQKKTIRVRRPSAPQAGKPVINKGVAVPSGRGLMPPEPLEESDEPGVVWALFGIAAMLVLCVVIYLLAAQAVGPNLSGTQLSSWREGPALSWPGKILN